MAIKILSTMPLCYVYHSKTGSTMPLAVVLVANALFYGRLEFFLSHCTCQRLINQERAVNLKNFMFGGVVKQV